MIFSDPLPRVTCVLHCDVQRMLVFQGSVNSAMAAVQDADGDVQGQVAAGVSAQVGRLLPE